MDKHNFVEDGKRPMHSARHLFVSLILAFMILAIGTIGYMIIDGWDFMDSLYMTVMTVSTVG